MVIQSFILSPLEFKKSGLANNLLQILSKRIFLYFIIGLVLWSNSTFSQSLLFDADDRGCRVGNSITLNARFYKYIELFYVTPLRANEMKFYNCGTSGDVWEDILKRANRGVLIHKPAWPVLMVGMNDGEGVYIQRKGKRKLELK